MEDKVFNYLWTGNIYKTQKCNYFSSQCQGYLYKRFSDCQPTTPPTTMIPMEVREVNEASPVTIDTMSSSWVIEPWGKGGRLGFAGVKGRWT